MSDENQWNVLLTDPIDPEGTRLLEEAGCAVRVVPGTEPDALYRMVADADVLLVRRKIHDDLFDHAPRLRGIVRHGVGLDFIPVETATARGIMVANAPGTNSIAVAEYVFASLYSLLRPVLKMDECLRVDGWKQARQIADSTQEIQGRVLGIVGLGNVGREVARVGHFGYGMPVLAYQPNSQKFPSHVEAVSLEGLFERSNVIVLCCPLTSITEGMVDARLLSLMHTSAVLINVGRGPLLVEEDLVRALQEQRIAGAALDVYGTQPLPEDHPFFLLKNLHLTPHIAGITVESMTRMSIVASEEALRILKGERPLNFVNPESFKEKPDWR